MKRLIAGNRAVGRGWSGPLRVAFAFIATVVLLMTMLSIAPSAVAQTEDPTSDAQTQTQDATADDSPSAEATDEGEVAESEAATQPTQAPDPVAPSVTEEAETPSETEAPSEAERAATPEEVNSDIKVEVDSIRKGEDSDEALVVGDQVTITGRWDASSADLAEGERFWVTLPDAFDHYTVSSDSEATAEQLRKDGEFIGFTFDVDGKDAGEWKLTAKAAEETGADSVNFRASDDVDKDISVALPGGAPIAATASARAATLQSTSPSGIEVDITEIVNDANPGEQLQPGDSALIKGTWRAPDDAVGGESFQVTLPSVFGTAAIADFALVGADGSSYGTCTVDAGAKTLTCTLDDQVKDQTDVHGEWQLYVTADERTTDEYVEFQVAGGDPIEVRLPGENGGIGRITPLPTDYKKSGRLDGDNRTVTWTVDLPGKTLADANVSVPGVFPDTPTEGQKVVPGSGSIKFYDEVNSNGAAQNVRDLPGGSVTLGEQNDAGVFDITVDPGADAWDPLKVYRITYRTTTDQLLPPGTELNNSFGVGDGVGPENGLKVSWKSGSFVGGTYENEIMWTILAPAREAKDGTLTITDTLDDAPHEFTDETKNTFSVSGATGAQLTVDDNKKITITIPVDDETAKTDTVFTVKYKSFYTGEGDQYPKGQYPKPRTVFQNAAKIGEFDASASVTSSGLGSGKDGRFNSEPVTVDGVTYPVNSRMNWTIRVSGAQIAALNAPVTLTDTLGGPHQVCEDGVNPTLTVRDRVSGVVDDGTTVTGSSADGTTIDFELNNADGFSRNKVYEISYDTCTTSGGQDARGTQYSNAVEGSGIKTSRKLTFNAGGSGTGTGVSQGSFSLLKLKDPSSEPFPGDKEFTVKVEEYAPGKTPGTDAPESTYDVVVKADGTPVSGFYSRGTGWTIRLTEVQPTAEAGVKFEPGRFQPGEGVTVPDDGSYADVTITPRSNVEVKLVNKAVRGEISLTKKVEGTAAGDVPADFLFTVQARLSDGSFREYSLTKDQTITIGDLPVGETVTFTESPLANTDAITWGAAKFEPATITVGEGTAESANVVLTNTADRTVGTFDIRKDVEGPEADNPNVPGEFVVNATWTDPEGEKSKELTINRDGSITQFGENLPAGTQVRLTEVQPADGNGIRWAAPTFSGEGVTIVDGTATVTIGLEPVSVTVTNKVFVNDGTLKVVKGIAGEAAELVGDDAEFTVKAEWQLPNGTTIESTELTLKADGVEVPLGVDLPVGTKVTFTEIARADVPGVEWGAITWAGDPSWLVQEGDKAVGIVSDDPATGRLISLGNEAKFGPGLVSFEKKIFVDGEDEPVTVPEAVEKGALPDDTDSFEVKIVSVTPALPEGTDFPAVGSTIELNKANNWKWTSEKVLPKGTVVTFAEVDPQPRPGVEWAKPFYAVTADAGTAGDRDTVTIASDEEAKVEIRNRPQPTTEVDIEKEVTGFKGGEVENDGSTYFMVKATWEDVDKVLRTCTFEVRPGEGAVPTSDCDATVIDGKAYFPTNTPIKFEEIGYFTGVTNVRWGKVKWTVNDGKADRAKVKDHATASIITIKGGEKVVLGLENKTHPDGGIIIPWCPCIPDKPVDPKDPKDPKEPSEPSKPGTPSEPSKPGTPGNPAKPGTPGKPGSQTSSPSAPMKPGGLASTGVQASVLALLAAAMIGAGILLTKRRKATDSED